MGAAPIRDFNEPEIEIFARNIEIQAICIYRLYPVVLETGNLTICVQVYWKTQP